MKWNKAIVVLIAAALTLTPTGSLGAEVRTSASACAIMDAATGRLLLSCNAEMPLPMASTTKVMTALLALEEGDLSAPVTCSRSAFGVPGTSIYLSEGETLTLEQLLYGLMLASGNDAATAIAEHISGSVDAFCQRMTERAAELGCTNTVFLTPHGLPREGHYTTARDLALIAREAMTHPFFRQLVSTRRATIPWEGRSYDRVLTNKNKLLATYPGATGIKTGYTKAAGRCLVFGAKRDDLELIGVVLHCSDWFDEAARLMDQAFAAYEAATLLSGGDHLRSIPVAGGDAVSLDAVLQRDLCAAVPKNALPAVSLELPDSLAAPICAGDVIGHASMVLHDETLVTVPILAAQDVRSNDWLSRMRRIGSAWLISP